ncbi:hypothetical protein ACFP2T_36220 [Plantactinospora solaniradicis]|uniref:Beta-lactamase-related domain-containing protein n=1 Tax=Plantactinospora solaniradicis TaxID=1723736 RepID=A0ABW1KLA0_9ACTN
MAAGGKADTTVRHLLSHQAGLVGVDGGFQFDDLYDDRALAARLAGSARTGDRDNRTRLPRVHAGSAPRDPGVQ